MGSRGRGSLYFHIGLQPAGERRHGDDAVRQQHGFLDAVRDEEDRLTGFHPHPRDFLLQACAGLRIEGGKRFIHQKDFRVVDQHGAIAARCCIPPDSSCGYLFSAPASFTMASV